jgi:hypothetical protein
VFLDTPKDVIVQHFMVEVEKSAEILKIFFLLSKIKIVKASIQLF